jgi:hypothetical protein
MLKRVKAEVREVCRLGMSEDAEDAALVVEAIVVVLRSRTRRCAHGRIENDETTAGLLHRAPNLIRGSLVAKPTHQQIYDPPENKPDSRASTIRCAGARAPSSAALASPSRDALERRPGDAREHPDRDGAHVRHRVIVRAHRDRIKRRSAKHRAFARIAEGEQGGSKSQILSRGAHLTVLNARVVLLGEPRARGERGVDARGDEVPTGSSSMTPPTSDCTWP